MLQMYLARRSQIGRPNGSKNQKTEPPFLSSRKGRLYDSPAAADGEHIDRYLSKGEVMIHLPQPSNTHKI